MTKKAEWVAASAPEQLTDFLDAAVANMHTKAVENDYLHKDAKVTTGDDAVAAGMNDILDVVPNAENVEKDADESVAESAVDVEAIADTDGTDEDADGADTVENADSTDDATDGNEVVPTLQKAIEDMLVASLKEYHDVVVLPLQKRLAELETLTKEQGDNATQALSSIALLPPAHAAANIKKAFAVTAGETTGNDEATEKEIGDAVTDVTEDDEVPTPTDTASSNLLTGF